MGQTEIFCPGDLATSGILFFRPSLCFLGATNVIFFTMATVSRVWEWFLLTGVSFVLYNSRWFGLRS